METIEKPTRGAGNIFPPPLKPYDWQVPIIKVMVDTILVGKNGLVLQPTATGKSVEAAFAARACILLHGKRGIYLYDENEGLEQARKRFEYIFGQNEVKYANFFGYGKDHGLIDDADIVFASFQSLNNHHEKWYQAFDPTRFDFMIVNEAHGGQAVTYKEVIDYFQCSKIGMTATPDRMDGKDILEIFGTVIFEMTLEEAIVKGRVAQIEYHIKSHGLSTQKLKKICHEVLEENKRISISQLNETIFIDALDDEVFKEIYAYAFPTDGDPRQTLLFCENIAHANRVAERIKRDGHAVEAIHSHHGKGHNRKSMQYFREGKIQFLVSINKLNEDIDVPNVEVAAFLRATDSLTVFFQQLGRTLRKTMYKRKAIILDFVANVERMMLVADLMKRVKTAEEKFKLADGLPLQKDPLHVTGAGFEFLLTNEVVDMMKVLGRIKEGWYETLEEASRAAQKLGIKSTTDYKRKHRYKEDPKLPSNPDFFYEDFTSWSTFLGYEQKNLYSTYGEAVEAVRRLGIKRKEEYRLRYKEDPGLPSQPSQKYPDNFTSWEAFFGYEKKEIYETYEDASEAARKLGIEMMKGNLKKEYKKNRYKDPKLPANPYETYLESWTSWEAFLGIVRLYQTYEEAKEATKRLGIRTGKEYKDGRYKEDLRLPALPNRFYQDWIDWYDFLGMAEKKEFYATYKEASEAAKRLGIQNSGVYAKRYKEDPKLTVQPWKLYSNDWIDWYNFLGTSKTRFYQTYEEAKKAAQRLGVNSAVEYSKNYKEDPKLHSRPFEHYSSNWVDWNDFLGKK